MNHNSQKLRSPDIILFSFLNMATLDVTNNLKEHLNSNTPQESWLYKVLGEYSIQRYNFFKEAKSIFLRDETSENRIFVDITYNKKKDGPINIFLSLGSENYGSENALGLDSKNTDNLDNTGYSETYSRRFDRNMSLYIYTENSNETVLLYDVYKSLIIAFTPHLELLGLRNIRLSGQDISEYPDFVPKNFFFRQLNINFNYETEAPEINVKSFVNCFQLFGLPTLQ